MKKLIQLSLIALAGQVAFSCSPAKSYYEFAAKDSAYGYKAPKKEAALHGSAATSVVHEERMEQTAAEEVVLEASAAEVIPAANTATDATPAAVVAVSPQKVYRAQALAGSSAPTVSEKSTAEGKVVLTKAEVKELKKKVKDIKKTNALDRDLKLGIIFILAGLITGIFYAPLGGLLILVGLVFGVLWVLSL